MNGEPKIVKNFLIKTLRLQSWEKKVDLFRLGEGVMPASFKARHDSVRNTETLVADFGEAAIGRVAPVDSGFWWIILLRAYTKATGYSSLADSPDCRNVKGVSALSSSSEGFNTFPTLLCANGCCLIDRRMIIAHHEEHNHQRVKMRGCCQIVPIELTPLDSEASQHVKFSCRGGSLGEPVKKGDQEMGSVKHEAPTEAANEGNMTF